jgi:hypothetical protein
MSIKDILAKVAKGEALTDQEKSDLAAYDPDKAANDAAAAARRKAEQEAGDAKAALKKLQDEADAAKKAQEDAAKANLTEAQRKEAEFKALQAQVAELTKSKTEAETKAATAIRSQLIRDKAKAAGIVLAPKTVSEKLYFQLMEATLTGVDVSDETALAAALEKFKVDNPGVIAAPGSGSGVKTGDPSSPTGGKNPWAKGSENLTEQMEIYAKDPSAAKCLAAAAGVQLD